MISIRRHLTLLLCIAMGSLLIATGAGVFLAMRQMLGSQFDQTLTAKARAIITASEIDDGEFEIDLTVQDFAGFGSGGKDYFEIRRLDGGLFLSSPSLEAHPSGLWDTDRHLPPADDRARIEGGGFSDGRTARFYLQRFYPKDDMEQTHQDLYLIAASPDASLRHELAVLATVLAVVGVISLLLMIPAIRFGLDRGLRPLGRLSDEVVGIRPEKLDHRLDAHSFPQELARMADRFNEWLDRLSVTFERERRFSANAAHELRTPLAELRMMAELGATWPEEATTARCAEMVTVIGELDGLIEKLSIIARAGSSRFPLKHEEIEISVWVGQALARHAAAAAARGIRIEPQLTPGVISTDVSLLGAILQNLIDNAVSHAPEGSLVVVCADPVRLSVSNEAPGLSQEDIGLLFEPFWRKDEARTDHRHSGLGMSIVKTCTELIGGECTASLSAGELTVSVTFVPPSPVTGQTSATG